jgi:hypothetical protein
MTHRTIINLQTGEIKQVDLTQEELNQIQIKKTAWHNGEFNRAISDLRSKRNKLLAESDYIVLADSPIPSVKKSEFMNYRTALRNLTQGLDTIEKINNVAYPLKPQI